MIKILFVDDEPNILSGLSRMLHPMHNEWHMVFVSSAYEAIENLKKEPYDIIVTDLRMPNMDGIELLEYVTEHFPHTIRFILSGQAKKEQLLRSIGTMHQYLMKPCDTKVLKRSIERSILLRDRLTNKCLQKIVSGAKSLPTLPVIYQELVSCIQNEEFSIHDIGSIILKDMVITAKILHIVNSSFWGISQYVTDIYQAISLLGIDTIRVLVTSIHLFSQAENEILNKISLSSLWDHSVNTAEIAKIITHSQQCSKIVKEYAYMGGILHDIGILILASNYSDEYYEIVETSKSKSLPLSDVENDKFGITHAEVGAYLLGLWGLPDPIVESVCYHHNQSGFFYDVFDPVMAVYIANTIEHENNPYNVIGNFVKMDENYLTICGLSDKISTWRESERIKKYEKINE